MISKKKSVQNNVFECREKQYVRNGDGSFLLFFRHNSKGYCVDATREDESKGRLINHSKDDANLSMAQISVAHFSRLKFRVTKISFVGSMNYKGMEEMLLSIGSDAAEAVGRLAAATRTTTTAIFSHHPLSLHGRCASILYRSSMLYV